MKGLEGDEEEKKEDDNRDAELDKEEEGKRNEAFSMSEVEDGGKN